jgi:hypothetical protein
VGYLLVSGKCCGCPVCYGKKGYLKKGNKMKTICRIFAIAFLSVILAGAFSGRYAGAEEGSCYLKANTKDVYVVVFDLDRQGNKGHQIWQGRINQGESAKITTPHGRFIYDYNDQPDEDQPLSGGSNRWCNNLETIMVP